MPLYIDGVAFDELAADPVAPVEGEVWYNTTDKRLKLYRNGAIQEWVDLAEHLAHKNNLANPHATDLEKARTAGNTLAGDIDMGGNDILDVGLVDGVDVPNHAARHIDGGADVMDGDKAQISWTGYTAYTPNTAPPEVDETDQLTAHLAGINNTLAGMGGNTNLRSISPSEMLTPGTAQKVQANGYPAIEFSSNQTDYASYSLFLQKNPSSNILVRVKFILKDTGTGSHVRIASRVKARATGEDSSTAFDSTVVQAVPITVTTIGEIFQAQLSFASGLFADDDAVALHIGRDGAETIGGGDPDDFIKPIQVIAIELEVP